MEQIALRDLRARVQMVAGVSIVVVLGSVYLGLDMTVHRSIVVLSAWSIALLAVRGSVSWRLTAMSVVALGAIALAELPNGSDLWYYQAYGRIVEEYHSNPYVTAPSAFVGDPVIDRTADFYRDTGSVYGPVFVAGAAAVSFVSGTGELFGRLAWQGLSFAAVIGLLILLRRLSVPRERVFLVVASPVVVYLLINQAHNDVFVGLFILSGVALAGNRQPLWASAAFVLAALIKAPAGIALLTYFVWLAARGERREVLRSASLSLVIGLGLTAPFGIRAVFGPLTDSSGTTNATSIWNLVRGDALTFIWRPERSIETTAGIWVSALGVVIPVAIAVGAGWRLRNRPVHEPMTVALMAWVVFSLYPSVWLSGWFVSLAALWGARESRLIVGYSSLLLVTSQSWLMPVAAIVDRGSYGLVERSAAALLGISTLAGLLLIALLVKSARSAPKDLSRARPTGQDHEKSPQLSR
jgi:hypothetical protein